jgi:hypothetical protein
MRREGSDSVAPGALEPRLFGEDERGGDGWIYEGSL